MQDEICDSAILDAFDDLAKRQIIVYGETKAELYNDGRFPVSCCW